MTHDAETVELVAAAMWESRNATKFSEAVNQDLITIYRGLARAALDAMPQPTVAEAAQVLLDAHPLQSGPYKKSSVFNTLMIQNALRALAGEYKT